MSADKDTFLNVGFGDFVEHKANVNIFGVVIGFEGSLVVVRLAPSLLTAKFHEYELQAMESDEFEPVADEQDDFTNVVDLATARAKGNA